MKAKVTAIANNNIFKKKKKRGRGNGTGSWGGVGWEWGLRKKNYTKQWRLNYQFCYSYRVLEMLTLCTYHVLNKACLEKLFSAKLLNPNRIYGQFKLPTEPTHALSKLEKDSYTHSY